MHDARAPQDGSSGALASPAADWAATPWVGPDAAGGTEVARPERAASRTPVAPPPAGARPAAAVGRRTVGPRSPRALRDGDDPAELARQICLDQLSYTARTRSELLTVLLQRGVPAQVAEEVLSRFSEVGLVDDAAFAQAWVARRSAGKGLARRALAQELRQRGVDDAVARDALAAVAPDQELEQARALVARRLASTAGADAGARTRRLVGLLARKGYPSGLAYRVVREALGAEAEDAEAVPDDADDGA